MVGQDYPVTIGHHLMDDLVDAVPPRVARVMVVHAPVMARVAVRLTQRLRESGRIVLTQSLPDAEAAKTIDVTASLWARLGQAGFTRSDLVICVGGGATTDLGGFVAATWLRGVPVIQVPTTVLGMVDAAVGGKTGINTAEGKNLVGAFHPPHSVWCDLSLLTSLPDRDVAAGLAEVVKCGFIRDATILELIEHDPTAALDVSGSVMGELVHRAVQVKADVVSQDLKEASLREILNYGHTLGHAIEQVERYRWRHGDAVAVGMVYAAELARGAGLIDGALVARHRRILGSLGLPTAYEGDWNGLLEAMRRDKKTRGATLRFVALEDVGRTTRLEGPSDEALRAAYDALNG